MQTASWSDVTEAPLYQEHLLLGAIFDEIDSLLAAPKHYGDQNAEFASFAEGCALIDLTGMTSVLVSGPDAAGFVAASCANERLDVGQCAYGAVVTGDGTLASVPMVARTGDNEYLVLDPLERGLMLQPWFSFLAGIEQDGYKPFGGVSVEDVSDALIPLLLWGNQAKAIIADYVSDINTLPIEGHIANVRLDKIECLVARLPKTDEPAYLVLTPPVVARTLWRSFLSFSSVSPVGTMQLASKAGETLPWMNTLISDGQLEASLEQLIDWELARLDGGFVGARALTT